MDMELDRGQVQRKIEILGTEVIPEFPVGALVAASAMIAALILMRRSVVSDRAS